MGFVCGGGGGQPSFLVPSSLVRPRAAEAAGAAHARVQLGDLDHVGRVDALDDQLRDAVALGDGVVGVAVVEEQDLHLPAVVGVDDARARLDRVLGGEAGAGRDAAVCFCLVSLVCVCARESPRFLPVGRG